MSNLTFVWLLVEFGYSVESVCWLVGYWFLVVGSWFLVVSWNKILISQASKAITTVRCIMKMDQGWTGAKHYWGRD